MAKSEIFEFPTPQHIQQQVEQVMCHRHRADTDKLATALQNQ